MIEIAASLKRKKVESILFVSVLVVSSIAVILPLTSPPVQAISRLSSAAAEDNNPTYDNDMTIGVVEWHTGEDHVIDHMMGTYIIEDYMTVIIPALNPNTITFVAPGDRMDVYGTLIFESDGSPFSKANTITGTEIFGWDGIYFHNGSSGKINDIVLDNSVNGIVFEEGSQMLSPGIYDSNFENYKSTGVKIDGAYGTTVVNTCIFSVSSNPMGTGLDIQNSTVNVIDSIFNEHGFNKPCLLIKYATVTVDNSDFYGGGTQGNVVFIGDSSHGTIFKNCDFDQGAVGDHYIRVDGSSILIDNSTFITSGSSAGALSVEANEDSSSVPAEVTIRNPTGDPFSGDGTFDNSTLNATGNSYIDLEWYVDVYVIDPDNNPIKSAPVWIVDSVLNPSRPPTQQTGGDGWAKWFTCTELTVYSTYTTNYNPFNGSAENGSKVGYKEFILNMSKQIVIIVPTPPPPPPAPPAPPKGLKAKLAGSITSVKLSWNASEDDGKGDNDIEGYSVYKSSNGVNGIYMFEGWIPADGSSSYDWWDMNAGDGDWNNYFYYVRANDTLNNEEKNLNKVGKFAKYLDADWNMFSVPLVQIDTSRTYVLESIEVNYSIIQGYHAGKSRPWLHLNKNKPAHLNHLFDIEHEYGYYVKMTNPDYLVVAGAVPNGTQIQLKAGWNLVDFPCLESKTVNEALASISGSYNKVEFYNTASDKEEGLGPSDLMHPGLGYWIHTTSDCVWEVPI